MTVDNMAKRIYDELGISSIITPKGVIINPLEVKNNE